MRKVHFILLFLVLLMPLHISAKGWSVESLPMVHLQDANRYVCNPDGVLSQATTDSIDLLLKNLEHDTGIESVIVVVESLDGDNPYRFGMNLGQKYGVGNKQQRTGLIVVLATKDRSYQILTGSGLEASLPDAICRRIENRVMVPLLKKGEWDAAMLQTMKAISAYVRGDASLIDKEAESDAAKDVDLVSLFISVLIFGGFIISAFFMFRAPRCPKCGKGRLKLISREEVNLAGTGIRKVRTLRRCNRCGYERTTFEDNNVGHGSAGMFPPIMPGGRFGSSRGSFGGSFGGGTFSGGGSGGRF